MRLVKTRCYGATLLMSTILASCGGGDGGGGPNVQPPTPIDPNLTVPFQTAMATIVNKDFGGTFTLTGTKDISTISNPQPLVSITGSGTYQLSAATLGTFSSGILVGQSALRASSAFTGSAVANGQTSSLGLVETIYFRPINYTYLAETQGTSLFVYDSYTVPSTVKAGDSGVFGQAANAPSTSPPSTKKLFSPIRLRKIPRTVFSSPSCGINMKFCRLRQRKNSRPSIASTQREM